MFRLIRVSQRASRCLCPAHPRPIDDQERNPLAETPHTSRAEVPQTEASPIQPIQLLSGRASETRESVATETKAGLKFAPTRVGNWLASDPCLSWKSHLGYGKVGARPRRA